mmetsp:Transcript_2791/g.7673  ORF Transcript_2791/g.7673 Transcript_2791/m.7673 type:complete len:206 (-) Transcript_2791:245-862(-)
MAALARRRSLVAGRPHAPPQSPVSRLCPRAHAKSFLRISGLSCSITSFSRASIVLSTVILPPKQESTMPPRHDLPSWSTSAGGRKFFSSTMSLHDLSAPLFSFTMSLYFLAAGSRQPFTRARSFWRHRTVTSLSSSIRRPCTISLVTKSLHLAWSASALVSAAFASLEIATITSCRCLIFSSRCLLIASDFSMARFVVSSFRIFS